jgi:Arylsulfotransferase (ASST)/Bacterial cadherin-like domain/RTX calcium-binding nonapeptide repeat (4 copies)
MAGHRRHTGRIGRWALPFFVLLALAPMAAQSQPLSARSGKGGGATCLGKPATLEATPGDHLLVGTSGADVIVGTRAADEIRGRGGNDLICGGGGSDLLAGGPGQDRLRGGPGDDFLVGGAGRDECAGNAGANTYSGCEAMPSSSPGAGPIPVPPAPAGPAAIDKPPVAVNDTLTVGEDSGATSVEVLSNDTDTDGGPKTVASVTQPQHGEVAIAAGGAGLTYEPQSGYCNDGEPSDTFTYALNGGSVGTVTVKVLCATTVSTDPPLTPSFDPDVADYTTRCTGEPLEVSGRTAAGATVAVDGGGPTTGKFETTVDIEENQAFSFTATAGGESKTYFVRCLPSSFPVWNFEKLRQPSHELYVVAPNLIGPPAQYVVIFDRDGVPVWWDTEPGGTLQDAKVLADGSVAWWNAASGYVIREPEGTLVQQVTAVGGSTDGHELQQLPNGNFLLISNETLEDVDLTEYGGTTHEDVEEMVVQEVSPSGDLEWSWSTKGHIGLAETGRWWPTALAMPQPRDIIHMNAIEPVGEDAVLISVRHTDAVYKIDKATGEIVWKLGGTWTPKSLKVLNDPEGAYPFGGQHDIRLQPDGTITIHDNNTGFGAPPRAVRYEVNEAAKTATLVEQVSDPLVPSSFCCGSARRSADGSWLMSWGANSLVAEYDATGQTNFRLKFGGTLFSYRAVPVEDEASSVPSLRAGMDAMHPR